MAVALQEFSSPDKDRGAPGVPELDMRNLEVQEAGVRGPEEPKPDQKQSTTEERGVDLEYAWKQEHLKRKRLQEDFDTLQGRMANVLAKNAQDIAELRGMLNIRTPSTHSRSMPTPKHTTSARAPRPIPREAHCIKKPKTEGIDLTGFSWNKTLDKTHLLDP